MKSNSPININVAIILNLPSPLALQCSAEEEDLGREWRRKMRQSENYEIGCT